ncbi:hypothetical protein W97_00129 [Coniosporium apollinis CBS 100218]|uniref:Uncharacterized protein n=1 Tax=Coniosporium apollinis (strain CBS 100218) TaxID=1168221 RepID=R7YGI2_CONA1|nr:uncharacterized protein W97_00129 [Coniosporium apollinis CBS 100218]EON60919.1 hypothetical protein W97_00129 [Coniosporium apollinis CBS 100218]
MSAIPMDFVNLVPPSPTKPKSQWMKAYAPVFGPLNGQALSGIRDQFTISTWLSLGAILQTAAYMLIGRLSLLPAFALVTYRILDTFLMTVGVKHNPGMDGVILNKFAAAFPDAEGKFGKKPARDGVVCFLIGARCNHPLGLLGYGYKDLGKFFEATTEACEAHADEYGLLGLSSWISNGERATGNEIMTVMYFKDVEGLHKFAHGPSHRKGWEWWNKNLRKLPHLSIWHEVFAAPAGHWEGIYANSHPTGLGATATRVELPASEKGSAETAWFSPIVDARKGVLKTSAGRMTMSNGDDHDKYGDDPYENYGQ